jgi:hypothetical protein
MSNAPTYNRIPTIEINTERPKGCCDDVLGTSVLHNLPRDCIILFLCRMVRLFSFGFLAVMLVVYLQELKLTNQEIGLMFTLTLLGDMFISLVMTRYVDFKERF